MIRSEYYGTPVAVVGPHEYLRMCRLPELITIDTYYERSAIIPGELAQWWDLNRPLRAGEHHEISRVVLMVDAMGIDEGSDDA